MSRSQSHISLNIKSIVVTGVNLVTEAEQPTTDFVAPVLALALHVIASLVGKPPGEKVCFPGGKTASAYICRRRIVALKAQTAWVAEHAHSFCRSVAFTRLICDMRSVLCVEIEKKYFPVILPSRYQYDPNMKIQQAMTSIWAALVPETKKTVGLFKS